LLPDEGADETSFGVDVFGMNYGADEPPTRTRLITIDQGQQIHAIADIAFESLADVGRYFVDLVRQGPGEAILPGLHLAEQLFEDIVIEHRLRQVFLKQIRAIDDGHRAALQQVTQSSYKILKMKGKAL